MSNVYITTYHDGTIEIKAKSLIDRVTLTIDILVGGKVKIIKDDISRW